MLFLAYLCHFHSRLAESRMREVGNKIEKACLNFAAGREFGGSYWSAWTTHLLSVDEANWLKMKNRKLPKKGNT